MKLTPEQIKQNAAAYVAAMNGKPWQWQLKNGDWVNAKMMPIGEALNTDSICRPAPEPEPPKPWTRETCPPLPFEIIERKSGNRDVVTGARSGYAVITSSSKEWADLLDEYILADGSPCGVVKEAK